MLSSAALRPVCLVATKSMGGPSNYFGILIAFQKLSQSWCTGAVQINPLVSMGLDKTICHCADR